LVATCLILVADGMAAQVLDETTIVPSFDPNRSRPRVQQAMRQFEQAFGIGPCHDEGAAFPGQVNYSFHGVPATCRLQGSRLVLPSVAGRSNFSFTGGNLTSVHGSRERFTGNGAVSPRCCPFCQGASVATNGCISYNPRFTTAARRFLCVSSKILGAAMF